MPTYQIACASCGEDRWPTLKDRPTSYVCARCTAVGAAGVASRKEKGQRAAETRKTRRRASGDATGGA